MAFTDLGSLGATGSTANNQTTLDLVTTAAVAAGELVVVVVAADNIANGGDDNAVSGVTLGVGGQAFTKGKQVANALAAQAGASSSLWYCVAESAFALGGTIRATFGSASLVDASGLTARHFSMAAGQTAAVEGTPGTLLHNTALDPGALDVTTANIACLRIRGIAAQVGNNTNLTPTASWTAWANGNSATTGTTAEMCARAEHRIVTGTTGSSNPTYVSAINASVYVAFKEEALPTISGTLAVTEDIDDATFDGTVSAATITGTLTAVEGGAAVSGELTPTFTVSSVYDLGYTGHTGTGSGLRDGIDDHVTSVWASEGVAGDYIVADLGADVLVTEVGLSPIPETFGGWGAAYLNNGDFIEVATAAAPTSWTRIIEVTGCVDGATTNFTINATGRYVRIVRDNAIWIALSEFRVYTEAVSGGGDEVAFTGGVDLIIGALAATEDVIPLTADSTLITADSTLYTADAVSIPGPGDDATFNGTVETAVSGTFAVTESVDTALFAATSVTLGALTATEAQDAALINGLVGRSGTLAATEGTDTAAFAATSATLGVLAATEGSDVALFNATSVTLGVIAAQEAPDTASFAGTAAFATDIVGSILVTEGADTIAISGTVTGVVGTLAATEAIDTASFAGTVQWFGVLAATEATDTAAFAGTSVTLGVLVATEASDTVSFAGTAAFAEDRVGSILVTEGSDAAVISGTVTGVAGTLAVTEGGASTWNPNDAFGGVTLSNGNLTATVTSACGIRTYGYINAGKIYWENTVTTWVNNNTAVGAALSSAALNIITANTTGAATVGRLGLIFINNVNTGSTLGTRASGNVIGIAVDYGAKLIWFRVAPSGNWNGSGTADPATGTGGLSISALAGPLFPVFCGITANDACTISFNGSAFIGAIPSGFVSGLSSVIGDTAAFTGLVGRSGVLAVTEAASTAAFTGTVRWDGVLAATELADTAAFAGTVVAIAGITGTLNAFESCITLGVTADSTFYTADSIFLTADSDLRTTDPCADSAFFTTSLGVVGTLAATEGADSALFTAPLAITGVLSAREAADRASFAATVPIGITGRLVATEGTDTAKFMGAAYFPADWEESEGLQDEVRPTVWLTGQGREIWLKNEIRETSCLRNPNPRVLYLRSEQARITQLEGPV